MSSSSSQKMTTRTVGAGERLVLFGWYTEWLRKGAGPLHGRGFLTARAFFRISAGCAAVNLIRHGVPQGTALGTPEIGTIQQRRKTFAGEGLLNLPRISRDFGGMRCKPHPPLSPLSLILSYHTFFRSQRGHFRPFSAISGHGRTSPDIGGHFRTSPAISGRHRPFPDIGGHFPPSSLPPAPYAFRRRLTPPCPVLIKRV